MCVRVCVRACTPHTHHQLPLHVRHWDTWSAYTKRNHLFLLPLDIDASSLTLRHASVAAAAASATSSPAPAPPVAIDLMFNWLSDCPSKAAGADASAFTISPDGCKVAFACRSTRAGGGQPEDMAWSTETSVFVCDVPSSQGSPAAAIAVKVSGDSQATHACPVFSPCGRYVA